jgi:2-dehydro-3-deoxyphosphogluconate aldolase/(4S)-4-hydroxy-2-oxoglutarate aldolase
MSVLAAMMDQGVIPVFYHPDSRSVRRSSRPARTVAPNASSSPIAVISPAHVFYDVTRHFDKADPSVIMGVGSIVDAPTAGIYIANGAKFVVGPILNADVAKVCNRRAIPVQPGLRLGERDFIRAGTGQ